MGALEDQAIKKLSIFPEQWALAALLLVPYSIYNYLMRFSLLLLFIFPVSLALLFTFTGTAHAAVLSGVSDLISTSEPAGTTTSHTITFTATTMIPAGGKIVVTPEASLGAFDVSALLDFTDLDFATAPTSTGPFTERSLAALPSAADDGVSVVSGTSGSLTITLGSGGA